jgi:2-methylisocitrate lyase-like PEP mutase family enzyme
MRRESLRSALEAERPLVTPLAHDALSARLIQRAGFRAFAIGGSAMLAARFALPDIGLAALGEMAEGIRDIADATDLPFIADGDDGYGDVKSVARTVESYERLGAGAILIEDQRREHKQQRAETARGVVDEAEISKKLQVAMAARNNPDTLVIARTDAYGALGLDAAIGRAERFSRLGVDGIFVAGLKKAEEFERVATRLKGTILSAAVFEGADTPWLTPQVLGAMGYRHVSFPTSLLFRAVSNMHQTLLALRRHADGSEVAYPAPESNLSRQILDDALDLSKWQRLETQNGGSQ